MYPFVATALGILLMAGHAVAPVLLYRSARRLGGHPLLWCAAGICFGWLGGAAYLLTHPGLFLGGWSGAAPGPLSLGLRVVLVALGLWGMAAFAFGVFMVLHWRGGAAGAGSLGLGFGGALLAFVLAILAMRATERRRGLALAAAAVAAAAVLGAWAGSVLHRREAAGQRARDPGIARAAMAALPECLAMGTGTGIVRRGAILVWDVDANARSEAHASLDFERQIHLADTQATVFLVYTQRNEQVGTYSRSGKPAYRRHIGLAAVRWPDIQPLGIATVVSQDPAEEREVSDRAEYGRLDHPIALWIEARPPE